MTVPLYTDPDVEPGDRVSSLCYEVHGESNAYFNLISDRCTSVNAYYQDAGIPSPNITLNVVTVIGVRAVLGHDGGGGCVNIRVDLDTCSAFINDGGVGNAYTDVSTLPGHAFDEDGVHVRPYPSSHRVRISVPNCSPSRLVMWVFCKTGVISEPSGSASYTISYLRYVVMRGLNLHEQAHGLIGTYTVSTLCSIS